MPPFLEKKIAFIVYAKAVVCFLYAAFWLLFEYSQKEIGFFVHAWFPFMHAFVKFWHNKYRPPPCGPQLIN